jgi:hypothetical protein
MLRVLERDARGERRALFWSTKSATQPRAAATPLARVWRRFTRLRGFPGVARWANRGGGGIDAGNEAASLRTFEVRSTPVE